MSDTHVDQEGAPSSSPFPVNALCNARTRYAVGHLQSLSDQMGEVAPEFLVHLGDLIHPVPAMPSYGAAATDFRKIFAGLDMPMHVLPGNHDIGDKPGLAPAHTIDDHCMGVWGNEFGPSYRSFTHDGVKFVLLNASLINSGLPLEADQIRWAESEVSDPEAKRCLLFLHYPPFVSDPTEPSNYDNIADPGRSWILSLLETGNVEAVFSGHVHHSWLNRHADADLYVLPSTSFTRQDYSEMFRAKPTPDMQDGRNDPAKTGYFIVFVYENGQVCHSLRLDGTGLEDGEAFPSVPPTIARYQSKELAGPGLGFEMRHPWAEVTEIAPSGALDDFQRKPVRNDYPVIAALDMGVRKLKVPLQDLRDPQTRARTRDLQSHGVAFTLIATDVPSDQDTNLLIENADLDLTVEFVAPLSALADAKPRMAEFRKAVPGIRLHLSKLRLPHEVPKNAKQYFHRYDSGFLASERTEIDRLVDSGVFGQVFDGCVFRIAREEELLETSADLAEIVTHFGITASVTITMADRNPSVARTDDEDAAWRMAEAVLLTARYPELDFFSDTFMDFDRGHSVRNGVIDRFCNPRLGYRVVKNLHAILASQVSPLKSLASRNAEMQITEATGVNFAMTIVAPGANSQNLAEYSGYMVNLGSGSITDNWIQNSPSQNPEPVCIVSAL